VSAHERIEQVMADWNIFGFHSDGWSEMSDLTVAKLDCAMLAFVSSEVPVLTYEILYNHKTSSPLAPSVTNLEFVVERTCNNRFLPFTFAMPKDICKTMSGRVWSLMPF
jgi:hypothetical protein